MDYETAVKLNKNGFPQTLQKGYYEDCPCWVEGCKDKFYVPTLSELIEACGDKVKRLEKKRKLWHAVEDDECCDDPQDQYGYCRTSGSTPEEAVANLWMELNKKL